MLVVIISLVGLTGAADQPNCEAVRDRATVRLEMAQQTLAQRETQLADLVVRYGELEAEIKALKAKITETK